MHALNSISNGSSCWAHCVSPRCIKPSSSTVHVSYVTCQWDVRHQACAHEQSKARGGWAHVPPHHCPITLTTRHTRTFWEERGRERGELSPSQHLRPARCARVMMLTVWMCDAAASAPALHCHGECALPAMLPGSYFAQLRNHAALA